MALTLAQGTQFRNDVGYQDRVYSAMTRYALTVSAETIGSMTTTVYAKRKAFAYKVLVSPQAWIGPMTAMVASDPGANLVWSQPSVISSSTNANPSVVTTTLAHGIVAGDVIEVLNAVANTAINGVWLIATVGSSTTLTIPGPSNGVAGTIGGTVMKMAPDADINSAILNNWNAMANTYTGEP